MLFHLCQTWERKLAKGVNPDKNLEWSLETAGCCFASPSGESPATALVSNILTGSFLWILSARPREEIWVAQSLYISCPSL